MVLAATTWSGLDGSGLTTEQMAHFATHGWVVLGGVLSPGECRAYIDRLEECMALVDHPADALGYPGRQIQAPIGHSAAFLDWFRIPGLLEAHRQLIGVESIRLNDHKGATNAPHPDRAADRAGLRDWTRWD